MIRSLGPVAFLLLSIASGLAQANGALYSDKGIIPDAVRQGSIGSCYFYASVAALAATQPEVLRQSIRTGDDGQLSVLFADGRIEEIHAEDVQFARKGGLDHSEGLWVAVLFRGYAQRTLRTALIQSVNSSGMPAPLKSFSSGLIADSNTVLLAYDRAIRSQIDQSGDISRSGLKLQLRKELTAIPLLGMWKDNIVEMMDSSGFFESLSAQVKANGELFGAYRAVGAGGLSERVLSAFTGGAHSYEIKNRHESLAAISLALKSRKAVVAWTGESQVRASGAQSSIDEDAGDWYVPEHAYTVLAVNSDSGTVTMRNPWGDHPEPDGEFTLSTASFTTDYIGYSASNVKK